MIARAMGARVVAVDIDTEKLDMAKSLGADFCIDSRGVNDLPGAVREITGGGAQVSMDALGNPKTCFNSVACLAKRGRHVQVGLYWASRAEPPFPWTWWWPGSWKFMGATAFRPIVMGPCWAWWLGAFTSRAFGNRPIYAPGGVEFLQRMDSFPGSGIRVIDRI
jgi:alcohol dehydrogenase